MKRGIDVRLEPDVVRAIDELAGPRGRSAFIADAVRRRLERARHWNQDDLWGPERALWARDAR